MSEEELKRFKEKQKYQNELFNDFALDSWCEESETINRAISRLTKEHFALLEKEKRINEAIEYIKTHSEMTDLQICGIENVLAFRGSLKKLLEILGDKEK